jgi:hypothetical protein
MTINDKYTKPVLSPASADQNSSVFGVLLDVLRAIPQALRDRADELRFSVDLYRTQALHDGYPPDQVARIGALELGWADLLDALGGRRP